MTLRELALRAENKTDKQDENHAFAGENYLHFYEQYFEHRRDEFLKVLEIGAGHGDSLRLWRDFFPLAEIHSVDIRPEVVDFSGNRIFAHVGDQGDEACLKDLTASHGPFDIVIDDGSHLVEHIITSFKTLFPLMPKAGIYAVEDLRCTYHGADSGWLGMSYNKPETVFENNRTHLDELLLSIIHDLDNKAGDIRSIHFHSMVCVIQKI